MAFAATKVEKLPQLACTGVVEEVTEAKDTAKGIYSMIGIKVAGTRGSRGAYQNILFRPEWFDGVKHDGGRFDPESLHGMATDDDPDAGEKLYKQYGRTIHAKGKTSVLKGLCGSSQETLNSLADAFDTYQEQVLKGASFTQDAVRDVLASFFSNNQVEFGYVLKQQTEKTGETDDTGKAIYALVNGYEIGSFFELEPKNVERLVKKAQKAARDAERGGLPVDFKLGFEI